MHTKQCQYDTRVAGANNAGKDAPSLSRSTASAAHSDAAREKPPRIIGQHSRAAPRAREGTATPSLYDDVACLPSAFASSAFPTTASFAFVAFSEIHSPVVCAVSFVFSAASPP